MRIETLYVALDIDSEGNETILTGPLEGIGMLPLVASTEIMVPYLKKIAAVESENYRIAKFTRID